MTPSALVRHYQNLQDRLETIKGLRPTADLEFEAEEICRELIEISGQYTEALENMDGYQASRYSKLGA